MNKEERNERQAHLIYGYRERTGKRRWYIGCTLFRCRENRKASHRRAKSGLEKGKRCMFHDFLRKAYQAGKTFEEAVEYFELEEVFGTSRYAELREIHYTHLYDALSPNGFVLSAGRYKGEKSKESRKRQSETQKTNWKCPDKRKAHSLMLTGWKHKEESIRRISEANLNRSPEHQSKLNESMRKTGKRKREIRRKEKFLTEIANRRARLKSGWNPTMSGPRQAAYVVIKANRDMSEKEVVVEMKRLFGWKSNRAINPLLRASGINATTYLPHGSKKYERLQRIETKLGNGKSTYVYRPRPEFVIPMIPEKNMTINKNANQAV